MKKFIFGFIAGGFISYLITDYSVRTEIFMKSTEKGVDK